MPKSSVEYLRHIQDECFFIVSVIHEDFTKENFISDEVLKRAMVRSLEIIGEATKKNSIDDKSENNDISDLSSSDK